jgi:dTDP-4-amino-4,6-dideoxygalactose transaminase
MLEEYLGVPQVRCLSSCTAALLLALRTLGIGPGDEVIVPAMTFVASANVVELSGGTPVFVDVEPDTGLIDLDRAEAAVSERTRAIMPVHLAGRPVGGEWGGARIGTHGNLTAYSFYVTKTITTIEGGALATADRELAVRVERLALHGLSLGAWQRFSDAAFRHYEVVEPGFKFNMTDVQAAIGIHQLPMLDRWIDRRAELWRGYDDALRDLPLELPAPADGARRRHARHLYSVSVADGAPLDRDALLDALTDRRIGAGVHYRGVHLHPYYRDRYQINPAALPVSTRISERTLSLPLSPKVSDADQADVVAALRSLLGRG